MIDYYAIGQRIRQIRKARGLSQDQLAEQVGISTVHVSHIENANTKLSLPVFVRLTEVLQVPADELLQGAAPVRRQQAEEDILRRKIRELGFDYDSDEEVEDSTNGKVKKKKRPYTVQRYKGLGEMDPKQLASTTMDPRTRILQRVTIDDASAAERAVRELMGNQVEYRREYIERHAHDARFLDA